MSDNYDRNLGDVDKLIDNTIDKAVKDTEQSSKEINHIYTARNAPKADKNGNYKYKMSKTEYMKLVLPAWEAPTGYINAGASSKLYNALSGSNSYISKHKAEASADIVNLSGGKIGQAQAWAIIEAKLKYGNIDSYTYMNILDSIKPTETNDAVAEKLGHGGSKIDIIRRFMQYQRRLFNFFADNAKFHSGNITVVGRLGVEHGKRLVFWDRRRRYVWEAYIEGVSHNFDYENGWVTQITVSRALPFTYEEGKSLLTDQDDNTYILRSTDEGGKSGSRIQGNFSKRFAQYWGRATPFTGGFFGEQPLNSIIDQTIARNNASKTGDKGSGSSSNGSSSGSWQAPVSGNGGFVEGQKFGDSRNGGVHDGVDFGSNQWGHSIKAMKGGKVVYVGYAASWAHGMIVIRSGDTWHCYQEYSNNYTSDTLVKKGQTVKKGQKIAKMTNDHLHVGATKEGADKLIQGSYSTAGFIDPRKLFKK